jgi:glyoxalase family protein
MLRLRGIHHITAIASEPQPNLDFYIGILGLRLVKRTVNFDDPSAYHFYFGDRTGRPGTAMTFFPWPGARRGARGTGQVTATSFAIPAGSWEQWKAQLTANHVLWEEVAPRFGDAVLRLADPDGLLIELITSARPDEADLGYKSALPREFALHGFHAPTLEVRQFERTEQLLGDVFGFDMIAQEGNRKRFSVNSQSTSGAVDLVENVEGHFGLNSAGTVHHIAFRCADEAEQQTWRERVGEFGLQVTPVIDRFYFHSIYFREPGGILFEIATDGPGFTTDEPVDHLGEMLMLPAQYEARRAEIERALPAIKV